MTAIEVNTGFDNIIPWHFTSTHTDIDREKILLIDDKRKLDHSIIARHGWLTKAAKRVLADEEFDKKFNLKGKQTNNRYKDTLNNLDERMTVLVNGYRRYIQLFPDEQDDIMEKFNTASKTYWNSRDILDRLLDSTAEPIVPIRPTNVDKDIVPKAASMLAPNQLTEQSTPQMFTEWCDRTQVYMSANGLLKRPNIEQIQYVRSFMSSQLYHLIRDKITHNLPVFMDKNDDQYVQNETNCVIDILEREFLRIHPTVTRRLEIFKTRQLSHQSSLAFLSQLKRDALAANLYELTEEQIICILLLNGLNNSSLRSDILDAFDIEDQLSIAAIENEIRKFEANKRTNNYVSGKSAELFKLSTYKKQQNNFRRQKANISFQNKSGKSNNFSNRNKSNNFPQKRYNGHRGRNQFRARTPSYRTPSRGKRSFSRRPRSKSRNHFRPRKSFSRSSSREPRTYKKNNNVLRVLTQNDEFSLETETDEDGRFVSHCKTIKSSKHEFILGFPRSLPTPKVTIKVTPLGPNDVRGNTFEYDCIPDSGASKSVCSACCAKAWQLWITSAEQESLKNASNKEMVLVGVSYIEITYKNISLKVHVLITPEIDDTDLILSWHDLANLKILSLDLTPDSPTKSCLKKVTEISESNNDLPSNDPDFIPDDSSERILSDFSDVISDTLPSKPIKGYQMKIFLDESIPIPRMPYIAGRNRPAALEKAAHNQIQDLLKQGIISFADERTDFMHPAFHVLKPNGQPRFIVDYSVGINKCIKRQVHPFIPGNQLLQRIHSSSTVFAVFDALNGYFQLELHPDSRKYTCFVVNEGRMFFNRAPQGLSQSADSFVEATDRILSGLSGCEKLIDDIMVQGPDYPTLFFRIRKMLQRCREYNIGLSRKKFQIGSSVMFCGHIVSDKGIMMNPDKLRALRDFPVPRDKTDTKSFLGLLQTFSTFYYEITALRQPLNELTKANVKFHWNEVLQKSFEDCKSRLLSNKRILSPFNPKLDTYCYTDAASRAGFGMAILQYRNEEKTDVSLIMCASRSLTKSECNYGITDLEITCCAWAICKGSYYLRGLHHFFLMTDHKSSINIFCKPWSTIVTPRQLRVRQKLVGYNFTPIFVSGKTNVLADAVSRCPVELPTEEDVLESEQCDATTNICKHIKENPDTVNPMLAEMITAAKEDPNYKDVMRMIKNGYKQEDIRKLKPDNPAKVFAKDWNRLGILGDLLIYDGYRIVVPKVCRPKIMNLLHEPVHGGITKTREAAKELYMWPFQGKQIAQMIMQCSRCIENHPKVRESTFTPVPSYYPMERIASDPFHFEGKPYLANKCSFTGWAWVHRLKNLTSREVISKLESIFIVFGKPYILQSDSGPCYSSQEFQDWLSDNCIIHETSSFYHSSGNGIIEVLVRDVKNIMAKIKGNWALFETALQHYNNLPRSDGISASDLMFNRRQKCNLPALESAFDLREPKFDKDGKMHFFKNNKTHSFSRAKNNDNKSHNSVSSRLKVQDPWHHINSQSTVLRLNANSNIKRGESHLQALDSSQLQIDLPNINMQNNSSSTTLPSSSTLSTSVPALSHGRQLYECLTGNPRGYLPPSAFNPTFLRNGKNASQNSLNFFQNYLKTFTAEENYDSQQYGRHNIPAAAAAATFNTPPPPLLPFPTFTMASTMPTPPINPPPLYGPYPPLVGAMDTPFNGPVVSPWMQQHRPMLGPQEPPFHPNYPNTRFHTEPPLTFTTPTGILRRQRKNKPATTTVKKPEPSKDFPLPSANLSMQNEAVPSVPSSAAASDAETVSSSNEKIKLPAKLRHKKRNLEYEILKSNEVRITEHVAPGPSNISMLAQHAKNVPPMKLKKRKTTEILASSKAHSMVSKVAYFPHKDIKPVQISFPKHNWRKSAKKKRSAKAARRYKKSGKASIRKFEIGEEVAFRTPRGNGKKSKYDGEGFIYTEFSHHRTQPKNKRYVIQLKDDITCFTTRSTSDILSKREIQDFCRNQNHLFYMKKTHSHQDNFGDNWTNNKVFFDADDVFVCMGKNGAVKCNEDSKDESDSSGDEDDPLQVMHPVDLTSMATRIGSEVGQVLASELVTKKNLCVRGAREAPIDLVTSTK